MRTGRTLLIALFGFTLAAIAGFATFAVDPARLAALPPAGARFYAVAWVLFAQAHVWLAMAVMAVVLSLRTGARWLPAFAAIYAVSLTSELLGTGYGIPFGPYHYSAALGPAWLGRVPVVIPLSWFYMAVASYALAVWWGLDRWWLRVGAASAGLIAWDLALDPAMSFVTRYWSWGESGAYFGMPWSNLFGWFLTGVLIMGVLELGRANAWVRRVPVGWMAGFWGANLLLPLGMNGAAGAWGAVLAPVTAVAVWMAGLATLTRGRTTRPVSDRVGPVRTAGVR